MTTIDSTTKQALNIAVLTVSDTRSEENDTSGQYLNQAAIADGHNVIHKKNCNRRQVSDSSSGI